MTAPSVQLSCHSNALSEVDAYLPAFHAAEILASVPYRVWATKERNCRSCPCNLTNDLYKAERWRGGDVKWASSPCKQLRALQIVVMVPVVIVLLQYLLFSPPWHSEEHKWNPVRRQLNTQRYVCRRLLIKLCG